MKVRAASIWLFTFVVLALLPATRDEVHWRWLSYETETTRFESYLKAWPRGRHSGEAREGIDSMLWGGALSDNTIQSYLAYISAQPQGRFARQAQTQIAALRADRAPYAESLRTATETSLTAFLDRYPGHQREGDVRQALRDITEGQDIVDLLEQKKIEIRASGSGIESVSVRLRRLVPYPLTVRIPVGTFFVSSEPSAQNMITTAERRVQLTTEEWLTASAAAACANRPRDIPGADVTFTVRRSPNRVELAKLMPVLENAGVDTATRQAAVWIATDDADYSDLGILVASQFGFGGSRVINELETARAMKIFDDAGLDIRRRAI